jgi:hypothetical protein
LSHTLQEYRYGQRKTNKSAKIRAAFAALGHDTKPVEVRTSLAEQGVKVSYALVAQVKGKLNGKPDGKPATNGHTVSVADLLAAKGLADKLGSIEAARHAVDALSKLLA